MEEEEPLEQPVDPCPAPVLVFIGSTAESGRGAKMVVGTRKEIMVTEWGPWGIYLPLT